MLAYSGEDKIDNILYGCTSKYSSNSILPFGATAQGELWPPE
jgi:hypothetical protein